MSSLQGKAHCLQGKGFLCPCTEDSDKATLSPFQFQCWWGPKVPPRPQKMGTHPAHELGLASYQFYCLCHLTRLLSPAGHRFAAAVNTLTSSTRPTEWFVLSTPCQRDQLNNPKKLFRRLLTTGNRKTLQSCGHLSWGVAGSWVPEEQRSWFWGGCSRGSNRAPLEPPQLVDGQTGPWLSSLN